MSSKVSTVSVFLLVQSSVAQPGLKACEPGFDHFPFCDTKLELDERVRDLVKRIDASVKPNLLTARGHLNGHHAAKDGGRQALPALGVPSYYWGQNCIHSSMFSNCTTDGRCSTSFPSNGAWASTFDRRIMREMAAVVGRETRAGWNEGDWVDNGLNGAGLECWGPVLNMNRDPRWGRNGEGGPEDPYLMSQLGLAWTLGLQRGDPAVESEAHNTFTLVAATLKHFDANSLEDSDGFTRHTMDANISNQLLSDYYWPAFRAPIREAGALGVMCSYNAVNGIPACASPLLKAARDTWGFSGYVTSDSDSVADVYRAHGYRHTAAGASCVSIRDGGTDIDSGNTYYDALLNGVNASLGCAMSDVDRALFNSFRVRFRLGLFDPKAGNSWWQLGAKDIGTPTSQALNRRAAAASFVLLQNPHRRATTVDATEARAPILPLSQGMRIAVIGPHANATRALIQVDTGKICPDGSFECVTPPFAALAELNRASGGTTTYSWGCDVILMGQSGFAAALAAAKAADVVIMALGGTSCGGWGVGRWGKPDNVPPHLKCHKVNATNGMQWAEGEAHDRTSIDLPGEQHALAAAVLALNKPTVIFLLNGGMVSVAEELGHATNPPAVIEAFYPGAEGGTALADAIFGVTNAWGKMPFTVYPASWVEHNSMLDHDVQHGMGRTYRYYRGAVTVPFGFGLSLTQFELSITAQPSRWSIPTSSRDALSVSVVVKNVGTRTGDEVVQAFFAPLALDPPGVPKHPIKALWGFERVTNLGSGQSATVTFSLGARDLQLSDVNGDLVLAPGTYNITFENGAGAVAAHDVTLTGGRVVAEPFPKVQAPVAE